MSIGTIIPGLDARPVAAHDTRRYHHRKTYCLSIEEYMETVTTSPKFQVVIPKDIRRRLKLNPGQKVQAVLYEDRLEIMASLISS